MELKIRFFTEADYPLICEWWAGHDSGRGCPLLCMLPKLGVVALLGGVPVGAMWLFMDNSVGVCWPEFPVVRPGLQFAESRRVFDVLLGFLEAEARALGYGVMMLYTLPAIARELRRRHGFTEMREGLVMMSKTLKEVDHGS